MSILKYTREGFSSKPSPTPDWMVGPVGKSERAEKRPFSGHSKSHLASVVEALDDGSFAMPPWQRAAVWTLEQRVHLLDSLIRGISIGPLTLWNPDRDTPRKPMDGCLVRPRAKLVIDGQQRLTTLVMAARGDLDAWRWNGEAWTTGPGFMTPSIATSRWGKFEWSRWLLDRGIELDQPCEDFDEIHLHEVHFITLDGSIGDMLETYERLATSGSPHSETDLRVMKDWRRNNQPRGW